MINDYGGKSLGWFTRTEILEMQNHITAAVYSFAYAERKPDHKIMPYEMQDTFYVGMSGGLKDEYYFDRKNKHTGKGTLYTSFAKRMNFHWPFLVELNYKSPIKYRMFHESYKTEQTRGQVYQHIYVPVKEMKQKILRCYLSKIESDFIYYYANRFDDVPMLNFAENGNISRVNDVNSISARYKEFVSKNDLSEFL
jgi:hypothetical protein